MRCHGVRFRSHRLLEMPIHIGINQTEYQCLIAYKCLVVAFAIRDGFLVGTAVGKFPYYRRWVPIFIATFLYGLYPIIRYIHCHAEVKTIASISKGGCKTWHATHFLSYSNGMRIDLMYELVGQS